MLAIDAALPDFSLPGIDGKRHTPKEYAAAKVLAVVFESNHCPASIAYEQRVHDLYDKYRKQGVHVVAINPNNPKAVRLNELGFTDMSDSFEEMKVRAAFMQMAWPYLYDGETQAVSKSFGAVATPHIFVFDQDRKLRYQGAIDDSRAVAQVKQRYAADAIDAVLAGRPVAVTESRALGCTTKWLETSVDGVEQEMKTIQAAEVTMTPVDSAGLKAFRDNAASKKTVLVSFWQVDNKASQAQFEPLQTTYRMYAGSKRPMDVVTISTDPASKSDGRSRLSQTPVRHDHEPSRRVRQCGRRHGRLRPQVERLAAVHRRHRPRRQGAVSEGGRDRHLRGAPPRPGEHPRRARMARGSRLLPGDTDTDG